MGSKEIQGELWGREPENWSAIQERTGNAGYEFAIDRLSLAPEDKLLDIGCGSGMFCSLVADKVAEVSGIDASGILLEKAMSLVPPGRFSVAEMEDLPFEDESFSIVTGFNSFQYAQNVSNAFAEARRVLKSNGKLVVMIWGNKEDCEAATYLKAVGGLLPAPPPGAPGPFALSENALLESLVETAGFEILEKKDIDSIWDYPTADVALKGLMSAGPVARAVDHAGYDMVLKKLSEAVKPYITKDGHVRYNNKFRIIIAQKKA